MRSGDFDESLKKLNLWREAEGDQPELLYLSVVSHRYLKNYQEALKTLQTLKLSAPDHSRAMQELGHVLASIDRNQEALEAYARATQLNPALISSWKAQVKLLKLQGHKSQAAMAEAKIKHLLRLPNPLRQVMELLAQGKLVKAEELCRKFLQMNPLHIEGMRLLANIGSRLGMLEDAEFLLESANDLKPDNAEIKIEYIQVLRKRQKFELALQQARKLLALDSTNPQYQSLYAIECMQVGDYTTAISLFNTVLDQLPNEPVTLTSLGHAFKTSGDHAAAVNAYRQALETRPRHCEAWYSLANLKTVNFSTTDIDAMQALLEDPLLVAADLVYLNFALGKAFEDRAEYENSFSHYAEGNRLKKAQSRYKSTQMSDEFRRQKETFSIDFATSLGVKGYPAPDPIFIVGLPRSGSTLLEQILSSHSLVDGTLELPNILALAHQLKRGNKLSLEHHYPENLTQLSAEQRYDFGQTYLRETSIHRQDAPYFIDKMPNNFRHIGLIKMILPNAKIIDARREPMACCFSGFKQLFAEGQEFSYDLTDIGRYYQDYLDLMAHWESVFPGQILRVQYEDVVNDLESQTKRLLDYCELNFEDACLSFYKTKRAVRTASSEQVRQPINKKGLEQWKHFEQWLAPLKTALDPTQRKQI